MHHCEDLQALGDFGDTTAGWKLVIAVPMIVATVRHQH